MLLAVRDEQRIRPVQTGERALCPQCEAEVLSRCGTVNIWHWAHCGVERCDSWSEGESEWHLGWKSEVSNDWVEICMERDGQRHRADIELPNGVVVELQHSSICLDEIVARSEFYGKMVWIFDVEDCVTFTARGPGLYIREPKDDGNYRTFKWKQARKYIMHAQWQKQSTVLLDLGDETLLHVKKIDTGRPPYKPQVGGWGFLYLRSEIVEAMKSCQYPFR